jgi:hypothetical protein
VTHDSPVNDPSRDALLKTLRERGFQEDDFGDWCKATLTVKVDVRGSAGTALCDGVSRTYPAARVWVIEETDKLEASNR